ncbi:AP-1 complex subunit mu-1-I [Aphelenchoides fujianensis]|nr:AP-1 complex subunit mu-1-I [Aphelenchoides fujianensis]
MVSVFCVYFKEVEEESIRDNFVIIYELMDEMMDFGYPQTTDAQILRTFITQESHKLAEAPRPPMAVTNAVSWRSEGIRHRKNEVFLDVIESMNMLANANGTVLQAEIVGAVKMRVNLSGMPELRLGLNDKVQFENSGRGKNKTVELEDVKFHQCVRLSRFENDRTISFIPPDGEFDLMNYRMTTNVKPLIWVEAVVEKFSPLACRVHDQGQIPIQTPLDGQQRGDRDPRAARRRHAQIPGGDRLRESFPGGKEYLMRAQFKLPSVTSDEVEGRRPIKIRFEVPYFTCSSIQVRYLKIIEKSGYQALPWVRYITQNGDYQIRMA